MMLDIFPGIEVVTCTKQSDLEKIAKETGVVLEKPLVGRATTTLVKNESDGRCKIVVIFDKKTTKQHKNYDVAALVAHEAVHVVQNIFDEIGEKFPGEETRAYLTQRVVYDILKTIYGKR